MDLLDCSSQRFYLLIAPGPIRQAWMTHLITRLAIAGPLRVLDGGNRLDVRLIARQLRGQCRSFYPILQRILVARAFTCHQFVTLLDQTALQPTPTVILDLLDTFADESLAFERRYRLLEHVLQRIQALAQQALVLVSISSPRPGDSLFDLLESHADAIWRFESQSPPSQPTLF